MRHRNPPRAITLLADGYEILRHTSGKIGIGQPGVALLGKPMTGGRTHRPWALTREVFYAYRDRGWIAKGRPYVRRGWQVWLITDAGREEARRRPHPTQAEVRAARRG